MSTMGVACSLGMNRCSKNTLSDRRARESRVAVLKAARYDADLETILLDGIKSFGLDVKGKRVLLKPNLVESNANHPINTHPAIIAATAIAFRRLNAASVMVGEGPGNERDTRLILEESGTARALEDCRLDFVDLNRDVLVECPVGARYTGMKTLHLPRTLFQSDFVVSMPKVKTHHWAGVTLSLKNLFGVVPGIAYGWPKNILHWRGIDNAIVEVAATVPVHFVVADGITAMEGNGPLLGTAREMQRIILADDPVAADATITRLMGFHPDKIPYLRECARFLGNSGIDRIRQIGEEVRTLEPAFAPAPGFAHLRVGQPEADIHDGRIRNPPL
ncbi:MAG: DUF362 domain-containing protein [Bryobacteraceae bacterium]